MSSQQPEVDLDGHTEHTNRQATALLSAAMAAAQSAAQIMAQRERQRQRAADELTRQADLVRRGDHRHDELHARSVQRQVEQAARAAEQAAQRQQQAAQTLRDKSWSMKPTEQWWHEAPQSAADAWASAEAHRDSDPLAARAAEQWETIFAREGIDLADVRARAHRMQNDADTPAEPSAAAGEASNQPDLTEAGVVAAEAAVVAGAAAGVVDEVDQLAHEAWTAYADGAPAARIGGLGVSKPPSQVLTSVATNVPDTGLNAAVPQQTVDVGANAGAGIGQ